MVGRVFVERVEPGQRTRGDVPLAVWCLIATIAIGALHIVMAGEPVWTSWGDTDDATRLSQVRAWLAGATWYDLRLPRFGGDNPLDSHWSRLIDVPIGALIEVFSLVLPAAKAELVAGIVWPSILLFVLLYLLSDTAREKGNFTAAAITLVLSGLGMTSIMQFGPGRIDHHSVMIIGAVGGTLFLWRSLERPSHGWLAGFLLGLGIVVGYEAILPSVFAMCLAALFALIGGVGERGVSRALLAFTGTLLAGLAATTLPMNWAQVPCDALGANIVLLSVAGTAGFLIAVSIGASRSAMARLAVVGVAGCIGVALYLTSNPTCIGGPFSGVSPHVVEIWLSKVSETQSIMLLWKTNPRFAACYLAYASIVTSVVILFAWNTRTASAVYFAMTVVFLVIISLWQLKLMPYAATMGVVGSALYISLMRHFAGGPPIRSQLLAIGVLNEKSVIVLGMMLSSFIPSFNATKNLEAEVNNRRACISKTAIAPLASLERGLAVAHVDLGPYLVVGSNLDVLAAPYHRLGKQIGATYEILKSSVEEAEAKLRAVGARYVVVCPAFAGWAKHDAGTVRPLEKELLAGQPPAYLSAVPLTAATANTVWELKPPAR